MNFLWDGLTAPMWLPIMAFFALTAVLWLLLPFLIFGMKTKLDEQLRVLRRLDDHLERLRRTLEESTLKRPEPAPEPGRIEPAAEEPSMPPEKSGQTEVQTAAEPLKSDTGPEERWQRRPGRS